MRNIIRCGFTVAALIPVMFTASGTAQATTKKSTGTVVIGEPCRPGSRGVDAQGRNAGCISASYGTFWVWSDAVARPVTDVATPSSWSEVTNDNSGMNAIPAARPLTNLYGDRLSMARRLVDLVNQWRAEKGIAPLTIDPRLEVLAKFWAERSDDPQYQGRGTAHCPITLCATHAAELGYMGFGEVIRPWTPIPGGDVSAERYFIDSPPHFKILTDPSFTHIGFAFHIVADVNGNAQSMVVVGQVGRSR